jgi:hypothetical protein
LFLSPIATSENPASEPFNKEKNKNNKNVELNQMAAVPEEACSKRS